MTRSFLASFVGSYVVLCSTAFAEMMPGPAIIGNAPGGPNSVVNVYADDGDGFFNIDVDAQVKSVLANADGSFEVSDLDASLEYFLSNDGRMTGLTGIGDIKRLIDSFEITQTVVSNPVSGARSNMVEGPDDLIIGGYREIIMEVLEGQAEGKGRVNPFSRNSNYQIDFTAGAVGRAMVKWHGGSADGLDIDFTDGGDLTGITLGLAVDRAGEGQEMQLAVYSPDGMSIASLEFPYVPDVDADAQKRFIAFSDFVGDADLTNVSAFEMLVDDTKPSLDAQVSVIGSDGANASDLHSRTKRMVFSGVCRPRVAWISSQVERRTKTAKEKEPYLSHRPLSIG